MASKVSFALATFLGFARPLVAQEAPATPITAPPQAERTKEPSSYIEMYDVRDLALPSKLRRLASEWQPVVGKGDAAEDRIAKELGERLRRGGPERDGVASDVAAFELVEALVHRVCLQAGRDVESCRVEATGAMVVKATKEQQAAIGAMLQGIRKSDVAIPIEVRQLALSDSALLRLKQFASARTPDGAVATQVVLPKPEEVEALLAEPGIDLLCMPRITVAQLDDFEIAATEEFSYIANFELTAIEGMGTIADPVIKTVKQGTTLHGRCVTGAATPDGAAAPYALRLELEVAEVKRPFATQKTETGTIQLPEVKSATIATTLAGTTRRAVLVGGVPMPKFDEKAAPRTLYLLVTVGPPEPAAK